MILLVDSGNTRTKWALLKDNNMLTEVNCCLNQDVDISNLANDALKVKSVLVASVAGQAQEARLLKAFGHAPVTFVSASQNACGVENLYAKPEQLGVDRWLAVIAAFAMQQGTCLVVNAGTAITVDSLLVKHQSAQFLGGIIVPGLYLMRHALNKNTAKLPLGEGMLQDFPTNTIDAIYTGGLLASVGAIQLQWQKLYDVEKKPPQLLLSGGDAEIIAKNLPAHLAKHAIIVDNLVLRGLMRLMKDKA